MCVCVCVCRCVCCVCVCVCDKLTSVFYIWNCRDGTSDSIPAIPAWWWWSYHLRYQGDIWQLGWFRQPMGWSQVRRHFLTIFVFVFVLKWWTISPLIGGRRVTLGLSHRRRYKQLCGCDVLSWRRSTRRLCMHPWTLLWLIAMHNYLVVIISWSSQVSNH